MAGDDEKASGDHTRLVSFSSNSNNKRSRGDITSDFPLNDIKELLIEVLLRLPTIKYAFQCKCVCKHWYSLISSPYFARCFITQHCNHQFNQNPSALLINYLSKDNVYGVFLVSDEPMFKSSGFEHNCLPLLEKRRFVRVLAIYKDLILCKYELSYYRFRGCVCNPFTKQCVDLPWIEDDEYLFSTHIGFVCEPYHFDDSQGECFLNSEFRFRVVHITEVETNDYENKRFILWTYCSEIKKWNRSHLEGEVFGCITNVVAYNGRVLWYNGTSIFAYDPFNPKQSTFIDCSYIVSTKFFSHCSHYCLGVCQGFLRMMQLVGWGTRKSLVVWELKDFAIMEWSLVGNFYLDTMVLQSLIVDASKQSSLVQEIKVSSKPLNLLGLHSSNKDIVYLQFQTLVISWNTQTRELKMIGEIPRTGNFYWYVFHIELPLWPTPIPS